jgi:uncharacterized glyoxalase superfamily protein PhnB
MNFGYTIIYTDDVVKSIEFFEKAFDMRRRFIHQSSYGELETGTTALAFASHHLGESNLPNGYTKINQPQPLVIEIGLITEDVQLAYKNALTAGASSIQEPVVKPWGQLVAYVRCPDGTLVELCSPVNS